MEKEREGITTVVKTREMEGKRKVARDEVQVSPTQKSLLMFLRYWQGGRLPTLLDVFLPS